MDKEAVMFHKTKVIMGALFAMLMFEAVRAHANNPPIVNAGADQQIVGPIGQLHGSISDDGLPNPPGKTTVYWSFVSTGPTYTVTFDDPTKLDTTAHFSRTGLFLLKLTGSDGTLSGEDMMYVTVLASGPINRAPVVNAGADQRITALQTTLAGIISDDGLPNPPGMTTAHWDVAFSTPGTMVTFKDPTKLNTRVSFSGPGDYLLRLTGNDGALIGQDTVLITVTRSTPVNKAPLVNAGADQHIATLETTLAGAISDDGLPNPPGKTTAHWDVAFSTPGTMVSFEDPTKLNTRVSFSGPGDYLLRLTGSDGVLIGKDTLLINVTRSPSGIRIAPVKSLQGEILVGTKNKFRPQSGEVGKVVMELPEDGAVEVVMTDAYGRFVKRIADSSARKGSWSFEWNGTDSSNHSLPSGVYRASISQNGNKLKIVSFVLIR
jgi:hypothetical protein